MLFTHDMLMYKCYQTEWHGINFFDVAEVSSKKLADAKFYEAFYKAFFERYTSWNDLSEGWRQSKEVWANFIVDQTVPDSNILSVGCGLGYVEHILRQKLRPNLFIHEVAPAAWQWVDNEFTPDKKLQGLIPGCVPNDLKFDLVYCATIDYALDDNELVALLKGVRFHLSDNGGKCLIISASFQNRPVGIVGWFRYFARLAKQGIMSILDKLGLVSRGQFWGWVRTRSEYREIMRKVGFKDIKDGFIDQENQDCYWISGS